MYLRAKIVAAIIAVAAIGVASCDIDGPSAQKRDIDGYLFALGVVRAMSAAVQAEAKEWTAWGAEEELARYEGIVLRRLAEAMPNAVEWSGARPMAVLLGELSAGEKATMETGEAKARERVEYTRGARASRAWYLLKNAIAEEREAAGR